MAGAYETDTIKTSIMAFLVVFEKTECRHRPEQHKSGGFPPTPPLFSFRLRRGGRCQKADKNDFETDTISEGARVSSLRDEHDFDEDGKGDDSEKGRKDEKV